MKNRDNSGQDKSSRARRRSSERAHKRAKERAENDPEVRGPEKDATLWQEQRNAARSVAKRNRNMHFGIGAFGVGGTPKHELDYEDDE